MVKYISFFNILFLLYSCEMFVLETQTLSLSGKYVVSRLDITNVDQTTSEDSTYRIGDVFYVKNEFTDPFDSIVINKFYIHLDESSIRMNWLGVDFGGRDIWEYGNKNKPIFYNVFNNTTYTYGYLQFSYETKNEELRTLTFLIEEDGLETLQLKSSGVWLRGKDGQKKLMTLYLTRVGP